MADRLFEAVQAALPRLALRQNEPLRSYTTLHIGGPARLLALPESAAELTELCELLRRLGEKPVLLGNGSNVLAPDAGIETPVIVTSHVTGTAVNGELMTAECGAGLTKLAAQAAEAGLGGLEFAYGIPGTLGGAVVMNAGAYGGEMKDCTVWTEALDENLQLCRYTGAEQDFSYRHSRFDGGAVVLRSCIRLHAGEREEIKARCRELLEKRRTSQPLEWPSAGSAFKRPKEGYAAAMIDAAGLKGYTVGGAQVSEKHAGFVINRGGATAEDMKRILADIRERVFRDTGITLEAEIRIL